jgi:predicted transcriptional regulator of viral defense system
MYPNYTQTSMVLRQPSRALGANEVAIYRRLVERDGPKLLTPSDARGNLPGAIGSNSLAHTLSSLESKGVLRRVGKGLYLNQSTGHAPKIVDIIPSVFKPSKYYLGLNAVANHWGLSPRIPYSYQVVYVPADRAQTKRVERWSLLLKKAEKELGGILTPVAARTGSVIEKGVSQAILDGSQLPISTIEKTIVDSVVYTEEIGGAGEALLWMKASLSKSLDYDELDRILQESYERVNSVAARFGFLLDAVPRGGEGNAEWRSSVDALLTTLGGLAARTRATYNWGSEKAKAEYFDKWHLHVSVDYLNQLRETSSFE